LVKNHFEVVFDITIHPDTENLGINTDLTKMELHASFMPKFRQVRVLLVFGAALLHKKITEM